MNELFLEYIFKTLLTLVLTVLLAAHQKWIDKSFEWLHAVFIGLISIFLMLTAGHLFVIYKEEAVVDLLTFLSALILSISIIGAAYISKKQNATTALTHVFIWFLVVSIALSVGAGLYGLSIGITILVNGVLFGAHFMGSKLNQKRSSK